LIFGLVWIEHGTFDALAENAAGIGAGRALGGEPLAGRSEVGSVTIVNGRFTLAAGSGAAIGARYGNGGRSVVASIEIRNCVSDAWSTVASAAIGTLAMRICWSVAPVRSGASRSATAHSRCAARTARASGAAARTWPLGRAVRRDSRRSFHRVGEHGRRDRIGARVGRREHRGGHCDLGRQLLRVGRREHPGIGLCRRAALIKGGRFAATGIAAAGIGAGYGHKAASIVREIAINGGDFVANSSYNGAAMGWDSARRTALPTFARFASAAGSSAAQAPTARASAGLRQFIARRD
jgi:hypothetical protein